MNDVLAAGKIDSQSHSFYKAHSVRYRDHRGPASASSVEALRLEA
jgi:hypothetical protein